MTYVDIRESLAAAGESVRARFEAGQSVVELVQERARVIDEVMCRLFDETIADTGAALVAVGQLGRRGDDRAQRGPIRDDLRSGGWIDLPAR